MKTASLPVLHPDRLAEVLVMLEEGLKEGYSTLFREEVRTCHAALKLIIRQQQAIGLTSEVASLGIRARELAESVGKLLHRK